MKDSLILPFHHLKKYLWRKKYNLSIVAILLISISFDLRSMDPDVDPSKHAKGAKPLSEKQVSNIETNWPRVLAVRPNKYGAARIHEHLAESGLELMSAIEVTSDSEEEFITNKNADAKTLKAYRDAMPEAALPASVDNSKLACFPPIGDQGAQGSCVSWATTYYHATHEYGLLNGINNKTSSAGIRSPKWTYNMINFGQDAGAYPTDGYDLLRSNGAPAFNDFPYDGNYREWDLKTQDWISALNYRMNAPMFITINGPADINTVKQILNNGHIVTFTTYANSWQITRVSADPSQASNPYAGQRAISWMSGTSGGHHTTIVGYDDNVWIDVNGNGKVDSGEKGAFLLANSWGPGWANKGFIWVAYDAFLKTSAVPNGPTSNRYKIADRLYSITPKSAKYTPKAIAKFSLSQSVRKDIKISLGVSSPDLTSPTAKFISAALTLDGGSYAFDGTAPHLKTATFALDLTDLLPSTNIPQKYYLIVEDATSGNPTTLNSYSILDLTNNKEVFLSGTPLKVDRSIIQPNIVFQLSQDTPPQPAPKPTIDITSPTDQSTVQGFVSVTANVGGSTNIAKVEFYVDSSLANIDLNAPFVFSLDTTKLTNGQHNISAIVYDTAGNTASDSVKVNVQNSQSPGFPTYLVYNHTKVTSWGSGSQFIATLKNQGTKTITDLKIKLLVPASNILLWNVSVIASDSKSVTIGLPFWKKTLAPGEVFTFGYVIHPDVEPQVSFVSATQA